MVAMSPSPARPGTDRRSRAPGGRAGSIDGAISGPGVRAAPPDAPGWHPAPAARPSGQASLALPRVWIVEDDTAVSMYLNELLRDHGMAVTSFSNAVDALHAYMNDPHAVDVVVTDQRMPLLSGEAMARSMLGLRPRLRVILCTGFVDELDEQRLRRMGVAQLMRKPFDARALVSAVRDEPAGRR